MNSLGRTYFHAALACDTSYLTMLACLSAGPVIAALHFVCLMAFRYHKNKLLRTGGHTLLTGLALELVNDSYPVTYIDSIELAGLDAVAEANTSVSAGIRAGKNSMSR